MSEPIDYRGDAPTTQESLQPGYWQWVRPLKRDGLIEGLMTTTFKDGIITESWEPLEP